MPYLWEAETALPSIAFGDDAPASELKKAPKKQQKRRAPTNGQKEPKETASPKPRRALNRQAIGRKGRMALPPAGAAAAAAAGATGQTSPQRTGSRYNLRRKAVPRPKNNRQHKQGLLLIFRTYMLQYTGNQHWR